MRLPMLDIGRKLPRVDEILKIRLLYAPPKSRCTLHLEISEPYGSFSSLGQFLTDSSGELNVSESRCLGGTYTGIDSMGLFWSMRQNPGQREGLRLIRKEADKPLNYTLKAYAGHLAWDNVFASPVDPICSLKFQRTYLSDEVERIPVRFNRLRGTLFKPKQGQSFPGVIDMFGSSGGLMEHRGALLAKQGFTVFCLAFFNYDDLPTGLSSIELDYFEEAVDYMRTLSLVTGDKIGVIGTSTGADVAMNMAMHFPNVTAVAWLNGNYCRSLVPFVYKGKEFPCLPFDASYAEKSPLPSAYTYKHCYDYDVKPEHILEVEKSDAQFLFLTSLDDQGLPSYCADKLISRLKDAGKSNNYRHCKFEGAGHLLEPPYSPCTPASYHGVFKTMVYYGGNPEQHNRAQVDMWHILPSFFRQYLPSNSSKL